MADAAPQWEEPDVAPGNSDSTPSGRRLKSIEGEGLGGGPPSSRDKISAAPEPKELAEAESSQKDEEKEPRHLRAVPDQVGKGYKESQKGKLNGRVSGRAKKWLLAGIGSSIVALIIAFMFGFLGIFKLEHIMSNIDAKVFARMQGVEDRRSRRWMQAYLEMRLADIGDGVPNLDQGDQNDNLFFRSEKVRRGPLLDWYRTMRTSKFEQEIFEKNGFKFVSVAYYQGNQVKIRAGTITLNDNTLKELPKNDEWRKIESGDTATILKFSESVDLEKFDSDGQARKAIRKMVNEDIPAWHIFLRRHVRKDIQNQIGVRDWRFFEKTRASIQEKQIDIRNRILSKAIPANFKSGQILRCLFGVDNCRYSRDSADSVNQDSGVSSNGSGQKNTNVIDEFSVEDETGQNPKTDQDGNSIRQKVDQGGISDDTAKLAAKLGTKIGTSLNALTAAVNITGTLEMLSQVHRSIPQIAKMAVIAKGAQAMGLFQVFETSRDQTKSGELRPAEYNQLMQIMNTPTQSEAWNYVVEKNDEVPKNARPSKQDYCQDSYVPQEGDFHYLCEDKKIGSGGNAKEVTDRYNASIGNVIGPVVKVYDGIKRTPVIGSLIGALNKALDVIGQAISNSVMAALALVGKDGDVKAMLSYVMGKLASYLGAGLIIDGSEKAGEFTNWIIQGGAYTAESVARASGAAVTTAASKAASLVSLNEYRQYQSEESTIRTRLMSLSNPESLASKGLFTVSNLQLSSISSIFTAPGKLFANLIKPFSAKTQAANNDGYRAAEFAGIETYDFPPECYNLDPIADLADGPLPGTNALDVFNNPQKYGINREPLTVSPKAGQELNNWESHTDSTKFYALIYKIITSKPNSINDGADDIAVKIYNCNLLDTRIRGSLGAIYGYTDDNGLEETYLSNNSDAPPTTAATITIDANQLYNESVSVACAPPSVNLGVQDGYHDGKVVKIRICALPNLPSSGAESRGEYGVKSANGKAIVNSRVSAAYYELVESAKRDGRLARGASSTFRTMAHQTSLCNQNPACRRSDYTFVAKPGTSNHQMGLAIDFYVNDLGISSDQCIDIGGRCTAKGHSDWDWLEANAAQFGIKPYVNEFWHWSPTGN